MIKETIILAPGADRTELLRSLALYGKGSFGMRIYSSAYYLAEDMLTRKGILNGSVVSDTEAQFMINSCMKNVETFKHASFTDAVNITNSLKTLRNLIISDEKAQMERLAQESGFATKNRSLLDVYDAYRNMLNGRKDRIDVIREAVKQEYGFDCDVVRIREFPLTQLEEALLNSMSDNVREVTLPELFGVETNPRGNLTYIKAYGNSNEVENTLNYIFEKKIHMDDCVVAVSDTAKYNQLLLEYKQKYDLKMTFANGFSINNTNPAKLLRFYYEWDQKGYHGVDPLMDMLYSSCFNVEKLAEKFGKEVSYKILKNTIDRVGQLKFEPDADKNIKKAEKFVPGEKEKVDLDVIKVLAEELGKDCITFISEYSVMKNAEDEEALRIITNTISEYKHYYRSGSYSDIFENILENNVGRSSSVAGSLIVTDIKGALSVCRKHLFVIGLSANNFPGKVRENYLLLDEDLKLYDTKEDRLPLSMTLIKRKKDSLENLINLYSALNAEIRLSYSCYSLADIKEENATSVLFDIYQKQDPSGTIGRFDEMLKSSQTSYLGNKLSSSSMALSALEADQMIAGIPAGDVTGQRFDGDRSFSPSALENFFVCPKKFYLTSILHIREPDPDEPLEIIDARDMGTLVHSVMEKKYKQNITDEKVFRKVADDMFTNYLNTRTPVRKDEAEKARKQFMKMAVNGFTHDPKNEVLSAERWFSVEHEGSGIKIYGYPDRVEKDSDGNYLIADYKTKKKYEHETDDINTCLQVVLYAYMMSHREKDPIKISYCTYRYLRYSKPVNCVYNSYMEGELNKKMNIIKTALDSGHFPCTTDEDNCKYCKFASICGRGTEEKVSENE